MQRSRFTVRRGMRLVHELHKHEVIVKRKRGDAWQIQDLTNGQTHVVQMGTFYSYYKPLGGGQSMSGDKRAARERAKERRRLAVQQPATPKEKKKKTVSVVGILDRILSANNQQL